MSPVSGEVYRALSKIKENILRSRQDERYDLGLKSGLLNPGLHNNSYAWSKLPESFTLGSYFAPLVFMNVI